MIEEEMFIANISLVVIEIKTEFVYILKEYNQRDGCNIP